MPKNTTVIQWIEISDADNSYLVNLDQVCSIYVVVTTPDVAADVIIELANGEIITFNTTTVIAPETVANIKKYLAANSAVGSISLIGPSEVTI